MDHNAVFVLTWACVAVFCITAIITLVALVGWIKLGGGDGSRHDFYLKALFAALVLEVVGISLAAYATSLRLPGQLADAAKQKNPEAARAPPASEVQIGWVDTGTTADWAGRDYAFTSTSIPKYSVSGVVLCDANRIGTVAVCWDNRPNGYPPNTGITDINRGATPEKWCTYKNETIKLSTPPDGKAPAGRVYACAESVRR